MAAGLDSLGAVELHNALEGRLRLSLPGTLVFDYPTGESLSLDGMYSSYCNGTVYICGLFMPVMFFRNVLGHSDQES